MSQYKNVTVYFILISREDKRDVKKHSHRIVAHFTGYNSLERAAVFFFAIMKVCNISCSVVA